jgi:hypothetical protein
VGSGVGSGVGSTKRNDAGAGSTSRLVQCECGEPIIVFQEQIPTVSNKEKTTKAWKEVKRNNYEAVLDFMRAQRVVLAGARRKPRIKKFTAIKMASSNPPSRKDLALFVAMSNGHSFRVQRRILRDETAWIKEREIQAQQQGKTSRLQSILEDEGVQLVVKEYTAQAGDKISAEGMREAVERYIADPENSFDQEDGCILSKTFS